ncbi:hypothetical protein R9C00_02245 [Flammeovirgaceae bacterium SG7u.111]|nr:hypothetical protein [Flammeovirgaceae bacterium SG7u.132]WPO36263.1 hypothetical protein R9C00_02245 [Flammeovirgaceae bacterium SG7u.111]
MEGELKATAESLHPLSPEERKDIVVQFVHIVEAKENETFTELCKRTSCVASPEIVAFLNGMKADQLLARGQKVKVIQDKRYR